MATGNRTDPYRSFNFLLEIDGVELASFSECSGLSSEGEAVDYREGTDVPLNVRKLPGLRTYANVSLKRGITQNDELFRWYTLVINGAALSSIRRNGSVVLLNEAREQVMRWNFRDAWPNKYEGPTLNASGNEVAIETIEIVHEGLTVELP